MVTAEQMRAEAREPLGKVLSHLVQQGMDKMDAYERLGGDIGRSGKWVRRILGRDPQATVAAHDWLNISALCARIEASTARKEAHAAAIRASIVAAREARKGHPLECASDDLAGLGAVPQVVDEERQ